MLQYTHNALVDQPISNDAFYGGDLNLKDFQELYRIPAAVAPATMVRQVELALGECNEELADWRAEQEAAGVTALSGSQVQYYQEAVFARAYGYLIPMLVTLYFSDQAGGLEAELGENEGRFFARSNQFLYRLMGIDTGGDVTAEAL